MSEARPLDPPATDAASPLERLLRRDRAVAIAGLAAVIAASWSYTLTGAGMEMTSSAHGMGDMTAAAHAAMTRHMSWSAGYAALMFLMWWVMMVAMMTPSAAPMILIFARVSRQQRRQDAPFVPTGIFAAGYLVVWGAFSLASTGLQWWLEGMGLLSPDMKATGTLLAAGLLVAAGIYQTTPIKRACLRHCQGPLTFITGHWRAGRTGALRMGLTHGAYCLGCCWFLMGLLFAVGAMNLYWVIGLAAFVLFEKVVPTGHWLGYATGAGLIAWGATIAAGGW